MRRSEVFVSLLVVLSACGGSTTAITDAESTTSAPTTTSEATTTTSLAATGTWFDGLAGGICFDDTLDATGANDYSTPADVVPCDDPHDNEIVAAIALNDGPFPAADIGPTVATGCAAEYAGFLGRPADESYMLTFEVLPDETDWAAGAHTALCVVYAGEPVPGSARSGNLTAPGEILAVVHQIDEVTDIWTVDGATGELVANLSHDSLLAQRSPASWDDPETVLYAAGLDDVDRNIFVGTTYPGDPFPIVGPFENSSAGSPAVRPGSSGQFAYIADPNGTEFDIYLYDHDSGISTLLTTNPDRDTSPNWSPDGSKLAFRGRVDGNSDIYVINADGTGLTRLTDDPAFDGDPRWSPDGAQILFTSDRSGNYDIWVMNADGSDPANLTNHPADDEYPTWSSDGSIIAFQSSRYSGVTLWLMRADGSDQSELTGVAPVGYPMFSPFGS